MFTRTACSFAALLAVLTWPACAVAATRGVVGADASTFVTSVEIVQSDKDAPAGFADALRDAVLRQAAFYGAAGTPIAVKIDVQRVHFKNPAAAMLIGDDNRTKGHVTVLDPASGQELGTFTVEVDAERSGDMAGEIALDVVGAFDPTGAVDVVHMAGDAGSAEMDRAGTTAAMIANFAAETLRQTFGDARARAAKSARENDEHAQRPAH